MHKNKLNNLFPKRDVSSLAPHSDIACFLYQRYKTQILFKNFLSVSLRQRMKALILLIPIDRTILVVSTIEIFCNSTFSAKSDAESYQH